MVTRQNQLHTLRRRRAILKANTDSLRFPIVALSVLLTSFFYVLPIGRYSIAGFDTDYRVYDFAFISFFFLVGLRYLTQLRMLWRKANSFHHWVIVLLFLVGASLVITALFGGVDRLLPALIRTFRFTYFFLTAGFIVVIVDTPRRYHFLLKVLYLNLVIQALLAFFQGIGWLPNFWPNYWLVAYGDFPVGTLSPHHKQIGVIMLMGITLTLSYFRSTNNLLVKFSLLLVLLCMMLVPIYAGSRTAWLGFVALGLAYLIMYRTKGLLVVLIVTIAVFGLFWYGQDVDVLRDPLEEQVQARLITEIEGGNISDLGAGRNEIYLEKIPAGIMRYPWVLLVGSGFQNADKVIPGATAAHNNYLQALIELGFVGLLIYIRFLASVLKELRATVDHANNEQEKVVAKDAWVFFVAVMVTMLVGETLWAQYSMFTLTGQIMAFVALATCPLNWAQKETDLPPVQEELSVGRRARYARMATRRSNPSWNTHRTI